MAPHPGHGGSPCGFTGARTGAGTEEAATTGSPPNACSNARTKNRVRDTSPRTPSTASTRDGSNRKLYIRVMTRRCTYTSRRNRLRQTPQTPTQINERVRASWATPPPPCPENTGPGPAPPPNRTVQNPSKQAPYGVSATASATDKGSKAAGHQVHERAFQTAGTGRN